MDRACGARGHARAEREHAGGAGGSDHRVLDRHRQCAAPRGWSPGPDGNLWFAGGGGGQDRGGQPRHGRGSGVRRSDGGERPAGDRAWVLTATCGSPSSPAGKIGEINPVTHAISDFPIPTTSSGPVAIVAGPNGNMWFTEGAVEQDRARSTPRRMSSPSSRSRRRTASRSGSPQGRTGTSGSRRRTREQDRTSHQSEHGSDQRLRDPDGVERAERDRDRAERHACGSPEHGRR